MLSTLQYLHEDVQVMVELLVGKAKLGDGPASMQDGGVIATPERVADCGE